MNKKQINEKQVPKTRNVLLIEDNPDNTHLLQEILGEVKGSWFNLECVNHLSLGLERLNKNEVNVVILNLSLADSQGFEPFDKVHTREPEIPVVLIKGLDNGTFSVQAVQNGMQDYPGKGKEDSNLLVQSICHAIEDHRLLVELHNPSFVDELTGLYNWRGFIFSTKHHLGLNSSIKEGMWLFFVDFRDLMPFNSDLNYYKGNQALIDTASLFRKSFRQSDIIARVGGGVFAVLAIGASRESLEVINTRFQRNLEVYNKENNRNYKLSFNIGAAYYEPGCPCSIDELIANADKSMYEQKFQIL